MTNEELDILASSYLDGEATPDEVAMVEGDPTLLARVRELQSVQAALRKPLSPARSVKEQQLAAALALFEGDDRRDSLPHLRPTTARSDSEPSVDINLAGDGSDPTVPLVPVGVGEAGDRADGDGVIDLTTHRAERRPDNRMRWLSAAAAILVFGFGAVFLANQMNSAGRAEEVAVAADDSAGESDTGDDAAEALNRAAEGEATSLSADTTEAAGDEAAAESAAALESQTMDADAEAAADADEAVEEEAAADEAVGNGESEPFVPPIIREDLPESGFFPDEPVVTYSTVPSGEEIVNDLNLRWRNAELARCFTGAPLPEGAEIIGYLPIEVTSPDGTTADVEALYLVIERDVTVILVDPETCALF